MCVVRRTLQPVCGHVTAAGLRYYLCVGTTVVWAYHIGAPRKRDASSFHAMPNVWKNVLVCARTVLNIGLPSASCADSPLDPVSCAVQTLHRQQAFT